MIIGSPSLSATSRRRWASREGDRLRNLVRGADRHNKLVKSTADHRLRPAELVPLPNSKQHSGALPPAQARDTGTGGQRHVGQAQRGDRDTRGVTHQPCTITLVCIEVALPTGD